MDSNSEFTKSDNLGHRYPSHSLYNIIQESKQTRRGEHQEVLPDPISRTDT